jgi:hypothetical protein
MLLLKSELRRRPWIWCPLYDAAPQSESPLAEFVRYVSLTLPKLPIPGLYGTPVFLSSRPNPAAIVPLSRFECVGRLILDVSRANATTPIGRYVKIWLNGVPTSGLESDLRRSSKLKGHLLFSVNNYNQIIKPAAHALSVGHKLEIANAGKGK